MKMAFVLFRYFPFGGLQRDFLRIAKACIAAGHSVRVYAMNWKGPLLDDLPVTLIPVAGQQNHTRIRSFAHKLPEFLAKDPPDRIIGFNKMPGLDVYYAADTCFQARARENHGLFFRLTPRYQTLCKFEKAVFEKTAHTRILLLSEAQKPLFMQYYQTPEERFHILPPGISRDFSARSNIRQKDSFELLFVGSGFRTKGLDRVLVALAALPPALSEKTRLTVIGEDHSSPFIRLSKKLGIENRVDFLGGRPDVSDFMLTASLLVHPARHENTGTVLLEAAVSGLPVLTTDVCGYAKYIASSAAGAVLPSPFCQKTLNQHLRDMLSFEKLAVFSDRASDFARNADIYSLPERAALLIGSLP